MPVTRRRLMAAKRCGRKVASELSIWTQDSSWLRPWISIYSHPPAQSVPTLSVAPPPRGVCCVGSAPRRCSETQTVEDPCKFNPAVPPRFQTAPSESLRALATMPRDSIERQRRFPRTDCPASPPEKQPRTAAGHKSRRLHPNQEKLRT